MRKILHRGKKMHDGTWVEGNFVQDHYALIVTPGCVLPMIYNAVESNTVGQYVGRDDEDGWPIFEKDIVVSRANIPMEVFFDEESCAYAVRYWIDGVEYQNSLCNTECSLKVIGNTVDNPELLKGE